MQGEAALAGDTAAAAPGVEAPLQRTDSLFVVYFGDDTSDEDAFRVLSESGLGVGILVGTKAKSTAAVYSLRSPDHVGQFLSRLVHHHRSANGTPHSAPHAETSPSQKR